MELKTIYGGLLMSELGVENLNKNEIINNSEDQVLPNSIEFSKKKKLSKKFYLIPVAILLVMLVVLSIFVVKAKEMCDIYSEAIVKMDTSDVDFDSNKGLQKIMYEAFFKKKNEKELVELLKMNYYYSDGSSIVNEEALVKIERIKKLCENFELDEVEYADVYLYIDTALSLKENAKYNNLKKELDRTFDLLPTFEGATYSYFGAVNVAQNLYQTGIAIRTIRATMYSNYSVASDPQLQRYDDILTRMIPFVVDGVNAYNDNDISGLQQNTISYAYVYLEIDGLLAEIEKAENDTLSTTIKLAQIEEKLNNS